MKSFFKNTTLLVSLLMVSCNSIATFNFKINEAPYPSRFDRDCLCNLPEFPGYNFDFEFNIKKVQINEIVIGNYWEHSMTIEFDVRNNLDERTLLPIVGLGLLNQTETEFEPNYFEYPYLGNFNPKLNLYGSLASKEKLSFVTQVKLSQNSNEKLQGTYYLHFLRLPSVDAVNKSSAKKEIAFIKENSLYKVTLNIGSIYSF